MLAVISGGILAILYGVFANLLTPHFKRMLGLEEPPPAPKPSKNTVADEPAENGDLEAWRARNRQNAKLLIWQIHLYGLSFAAMYAAFYIPIVLNTQFGTHPLDLEVTRLGISYVLQPESFTYHAVALALLAYVPCWWLAQRIATALARIWSNYVDVNVLRFGALVGLTMVALGLFVGGNVTWAINARMGYLEAVALPFGIVLVLGFLGGGKR